MRAWGTTSERLVLWSIFAAISALLIAFAWNNVSAGFLSDDAVYLMTADGFSPFHQADPRLHAYIMRQSIFPPGYSLLLGILGGGSGNLLWSHIITSSTLAMGLLAMWRWLSLETGQRNFALGAVVVYALLPGTLLHDTTLMSEFPYLMLTMLAFWLVSGTQPGGNRLLLAALCIGLAAITRSAGYSLVLAAFVWMFGKRIDRKIHLVALSLAPFACWYLYQHVGGAHAQGGYDQLWGSLIARARSEGMLQFWPKYAAGQFMALWTGLLGNLTIVPSAAAPALGAFLLLTALPIWITRLRRWELDAWYLGIASGVTLLYPFPDHFVRLVVPLLPIAVAYSFLCINQLRLRLRDLRYQNAVAIGLPVLLVVCVMPSLYFMAERFNQTLDPALSSWKRTNYWYKFGDVDELRDELANRQLMIDVARDLRDHVPENECLVAVRPALVMLFSHRIVESPPQPSRFAGDRMDFLLRECPNLFLLGAPGSIAQEPVPAYYPGDLIAADNIGLVYKWDNPHNPDKPIGLLLRRTSGN